MNRNRWIGKWLIFVALLHTLFALAMFRETLTQILAAGVFDTVGRDPMRAATVWFLLFGAGVLLFGLVVDSLEKADIPLSATVGVCMLLLALLGVILMPRSGFWLLFPPAVFVLVKMAGVKTEASP